NRILGRFRYGMEQDKRHVLADDRGRLEQLFVLRREPVDSGRQNDLDGCWNLDGLDRASQIVRAALTRERTRLLQRPDALLDEEGVPSFHERPLEGRQGRVVAQESAQELVRTLGRQSVETQLAIVGLADPTVLILGPVVDE